MILLGSSTGCSMMDNAYRHFRRAEKLNEFMLSHRNSTFAAKAWFAEKDCHRNQSDQGEFKAGFIQGYIDVADGGSGCCPSVAPSSYWGWKYQSPGGHAAVGAWFAGYPYGAKAAEQDGLGQFSQMQVVQKQPATADDKTDPEAAPGDLSPVMTGPDGLPLPLLEEIVVPGSERIVPTPSGGDMLELQPSIETLDLPAPSVTEPAFQGRELNVPSLNDDASLNFQTPEPPIVSDDFEMVENLVVRESPQIYSLSDSDDGSSDLESQEGLGDDVIEGIFGSIELPKDVSLTAPQSTDLQQTETRIETARVNDEDIPFTFE